MWDLYHNKSTQFAQLVPIFKHVNSTNSFNLLVLPMHLSIKVWKQKYICFTFALLVCLFLSWPRIFHLYGAVLIAGEELCSEGSFTCHTYCDMEHLFCRWHSHVGKCHCHYIFTTPWVCRLGLFASHTRKAEGQKCVGWILDCLFSNPTFI